MVNPKATSSGVQSKVDRRMGVLYRFLGSLESNRLVALVDLVYIVHLVDVV
jgi:hypothetical protein